MTDTKLAKQIEELELAAREAMRALMLTLAMHKESQIEQTEEEKQIEGLRSNLFDVTLDPKAHEQIAAAAQRLEDLGVDLSAYSSSRVVDVATPAPTVDDALAQKPLVDQKAFDDLADIVDDSIDKLARADADLVAVSRQRSAIDQMLKDTQNELAERKESNVESLDDLDVNDRLDIESILSHLERGMILTAHEEENDHLKPDTDGRYENTFTIVRDDSTSFEIAVKIIPQ